MKTTKLFTKDFTMVIIGQIISLFGNAMLRFALPLYLLNETGSAALFGIVSACAFIPMILFAPIGGIFADRVNKRNIMVILDFSTAALTFIVEVLLGTVSLVPLIIVALIILYGIQGAYQPSVQASIPALVSPEFLIPANSAVNLVNSLSGLLGPVIGGMVFGLYGIKLILIICFFCFLASAIMEMFIHIPFNHIPVKGTVFSIVKSDIKDSLYFIKFQQPIIAKIVIFIAAINMVFSALFIIGMPVVVTQHLGFSQQLGNQLYGYCEGAIAAGGLIGGVLSGILSKKLKIQNSYMLILGCAVTLMPISLTLLLKPASMVSYIIIFLCCLIMMIISTIFSVEMLAYVQGITPSDLIGKIMSLAMCFSMCASPLGQGLYGWIFQVLPEKIYLIFLVAAIISGIIGLLSKRTFQALNSTIKNSATF